MQSIPRPWNDWGTEIVVSHTTPSRFAGVIADGSTDLEILSRFISCVPKRQNQIQVVKLGQKLRDAMDEFWREASRTNSYGVTQEPGRKLRNRIVRILFAAVEEFDAQVSGHYHFAICLF